MTVMEYMARFTEFARFGDDYVATDVVKVRRFENGLKLSFRGKIVGLRWSPSGPVGACSPIVKGLHVHAIRPSI